MSRPTGSADDLRGRGKFSDGPARTRALAVEAIASMKGRAYQLLTDFKSNLRGAAAPFLMSRLILRARILPDSITPELDDPAIEKRLDEAIRALLSEQNMAP